MAAVILCYGNCHPENRIAHWTSYEFPTKKYLGFLKGDKLLMRRLLGIPRRVTCSVRCQIRQDLAEPNLPLGRIASQGREKCPVRFIDIDISTLNAYMA